MEKTIRNCELRFAFDCPAVWSRLRPTEDPKARDCDRCQKRVYDCQNGDELEAAESGGHRVAMAVGLSGQTEFSRVRLGKLREMRDRQRQSGSRIGYHLIKTGAIDESKVTDFLSRQYGVPAINLKEFQIDPQVLKLIPGEIALKLYVIPVNVAAKTLILAMSDPSDIFAIDEVRSLTGMKVETVVASEVSLIEAIYRNYEISRPR